MILGKTQMNSGTPRTCFEWRNSNHYHFANQEFGVSWPSGHFCKLRLILCPPRFSCTLRAKEDDMKILQITPCFYFKNWCHPVDICRCSISSQPGRILATKCRHRCYIISPWGSPLGVGTSVILCEATSISYGPSSWIDLWQVSQLSFFLFLPL